MSGSYPPSFSENEWAFAWALFSLLTISSLTTATLARFVNDGVTFGWRWNQPLALARMIACGLLCTILVGALPDAIFLLAWGEVSQPALDRLLLFDRACDGLAIVPFLATMLLIARAEPAILFMLTRTPIPTELWPTWPMVRRQLAMVGLIVVIAAGVTVGK